MAVAAVVAVAEGDMLQNLYVAKNVGDNLSTVLDTHFPSSLYQVGKKRYKGDCIRLCDAALVVLGEEHLQSADFEDICGAEEAFGFLYVSSLGDIRRATHALSGGAFLYLYVLLSDHQKLRFHFLIHWTKDRYRRCYSQVPVHTQRFFSSQIQMRYSALSLPMYR